MTTLITGRIIDETRVLPLTEDEALIYAQLVKEGVLSHGFLSHQTPQFVAFSEIAELDQLEAALWRLPLVAQGVMALGYQQVQPLQP